MANGKRKVGDSKKMVLSTNKTSGLHDVTPNSKTRSTKSRGRPLAVAHLRPHTSNGKIYYYYCRGRDPEIYLGSADTILSWKPNVT